MSWRVMPYSRSGSPPLSKPLAATAVAGLVGKGIISLDEVHEYTWSCSSATLDYVTFDDLDRNGLPGNFGNNLEHIATADRPACIMPF
jgi:hypothetical protein